MSLKNLIDKNGHLDVPSGVTSIGYRAFSGCAGLTSVHLPEGLTSIGDCAFYGCTGLTSVHLPEGLTSIGGCAFYGCTGLTSVHLPDSLTSIVDRAFSEKTKLICPAGKFAVITPRGWVAHNFGGGLTIGCQHHDLAWWEAKGEELARENGVTSEAELTQLAKLIKRAKSV